MRKVLTLSAIGLSAFVMSCNGKTATDIHNHSEGSRHHYVVPSASSVKDVIPGKIFVDMKDDVSDEDIAELSKLAGTNLRATNDTERMYKYESGDVDPANEDAILAALRADSRVEHAEPMIKMNALYVPNDPNYESDQWHMRRVGSESSWGMSCGMGVKVAVIDTGIDNSLSDLAGTKITSGWNFVDDDEDTNDGNRHGSHVAGTIAQATNNGLGGAGLAPCVTILPVKVLSDSGSGSSEGVAAGIRYAADQGVQVINMSLGSSQPSDIIEDAVDYAHDKGVIVVCAAGNDSGPVGFPAAFFNAVAISATDQRDNIAKFSSRGEEVALGAPGVDVYQQTIGNKFEKLSGTSMSSPHSAAAAALVVSSGISDPDAVRDRLQSSADHMGNPDLFGAGILRADSAIRSTFFSHFMLRMFALLGLMFFMRKTITADMIKNKLSMAGIVLGGFGVLPILFLGVLPHMGFMRIFGELAMRPVAEWDILFGFHKYLILASAIPTTALSLLLLGHNKAKLFAGGFAIGSAALGTQMFYSNDTHFFLGGFIARIVMAASVFVCCYFAKAAFDKKA